MKEELDKLNAEYNELAKQYKKYEEEFDNLDVEMENIELKKREVKKKMVQIKEDNFEEGLTHWVDSLKEEDKQDTEENWYGMFKLTPEEKLKARYIEQELHAGYSGAIGGSATFHFTPTSLGVIVSITVDGQDYTLTDFSNF